MNHCASGAVGPQVRQVLRGQGLAKSPHRRRHQSVVGVGALRDVRVIQERISSGDIPNSTPQPSQNLVEPWWNLVEPCLRAAPDHRSQSGLRPQTFQLFGKKQLGIGLRF